MVERVLDRDESTRRPTAEALKQRLFGLPGIPPQDAAPATRRRPDERPRAAPRRTARGKRVLRPPLSIAASIHLDPRPALSTIDAPADSMASGRQSGSTQIAGLRTRFTL